MTSSLIRFFDASALVKRYVAEPGSDDVRRLLGECQAAASRLSLVEIASALARRRREGSLDGSKHERASTAVDRDFGALYVVEMSARVARGASRLLVRHPLRAGDAVQLASCLELRHHLGIPVAFVAADLRLLAAAADEGVEAVAVPVS